jgi:GH43 family beta-xylosidase
MISWQILLFMFSMESCTYILHMTGNAGIPENDNGDHFDMNDYHVFSTSDIESEPLTDHGVVLKTSDIAWAGRQLWDCDVAFKNGKYYMYFPLKDRTDIFRLGVAISGNPGRSFHCSARSHQRKL